MSETTVNVENVRKVIDVIKTKEHHKGLGEKNVDGFNMRTYFFGCGTPACIAGWTDSIAKKENPNYRDGQYIEEAAGEYLGVYDYSETRNLFYPVINSEMLGGDIKVRSLYDGEIYEVSQLDPDFEEITPGEAVETLEKLISTGKVDWSHCLHRVQNVAVVEIGGKSYER